VPPSSSEQTTSKRELRARAPPSTPTKEAAHINKSLSALAGVFSALNRKQTHVPYRDSKLTFLLQPALSGDGKTLLFVNLSPTPGSANESLCSLRFAKQVQSVELGKAKRHIETVH
jgi:kinesin family protein C1